MVKSMPKMKYSRKKAVKKIAFITAWLVENPEAYKDKTNADIEKEILEEISLIPYVADREGHCFGLPPLGLPLNGEVQSVASHPRLLDKKVCLLVRLCF